MVLELSQARDFTSSLSPEQDNVAAQNTSVGAGVSDSSAMNGVPIQIVSPAGNKVERSKEAGESLKIGGPDDGGDVNDEKEKGAAEGGSEDENFILSDDEDEEDANNTSDGDDEDEEGEEEEKGAVERGSKDGDFIVCLNRKSGDDDDDEDEEDEGEDGDVYKDDLMKVDDEDGGVENKVDDLDDGKEGDRTIEEGSGKKENEDKRGVSLEPEVEKLKKKKVIKKVVRRVLEKVVVRNKDKLEGDEKNEPMDEEKGNKKEEVEEKGEGSLKKKVKRLMKGDKKKIISGSSEKAVPKPKNTLNSKHRKNDSKRAESMGMIFMCSSKTKQDCFRYHVLGLPAGKRNLVEKIYKGMRLFLYDVDLKLLYGIYKATGRGGYNIEPKAFNSMFPSQVRFTILEDCIPLAEEKFRKVIKDNYFTKKKFDCQLKHEQVKNLCKLFLAANKGSKSKRLDRSHKAKAQASIHQDRSRAQGVDERRRSGLVENHGHRDYFHVREREVVASPVARVSQVAPIPSPIAASRYGYDRILERDAYRQNIWEEHRDPYRQPLLASQEEHRDPYRQPLLASRDAYRRQPLSEYRDLYRQEPLLDHYDGYRRDGAPEHRDLRPMNLPVRHRNEVARHDPYGFYRERQSYRGAAYPEHLPAEPERYNSVPTEYRARGAPISDYRFTGGLQRY